MHRNVTAALARAVAESYSKAASVRPSVRPPSQSPDSSGSTYSSVRPRPPPPPPPPSLRGTKHCSAPLSLLSHRGSALLARSQAHYHSTTPPPPTYTLAPSPRFDPPCNAYVTAKHANLMPARLPKYPRLACVTYARQCHGVRVQVQVQHHPPSLPSIPSIPSIPPTAETAHPRSPHVYGIRIRDRSEDSSGRRHAMSATATNRGWLALRCSISIALPPSLPRDPLLFLADHESESELNGAWRASLHRGDKRVKWDEETE